MDELFYTKISTVLSAVFGDSLLNHLSLYRTGNGCVYLHALSMRRLCIL